MQKIKYQKWLHEKQKTNINPVILLYSVVTLSGCYAHNRC